MRQLLMIFFLFTGLAGLGQNAVWEWAKRIGTPDIDYCNDIVTDNNGDVIITGESSGTPLVIDTFNLYFNSYFVIKYSAEGELLWARGSDTSIFSNGSGISLLVDSGNSILVCSFGYMVPNGTDTAWIPGINLIKYEETGNLLWAKRICETQNSFPYVLASDLDSNIFLSGYYGNSGIQIGDTSLVSLGFMDLFMAKFDSTGNFIWAKRFGGPYDNYCFDMEIDINDHVYLTGKYIGSMNLSDSISLISNGNWDAFIIKLSQNGEIIWAKNIGGTGDEDGYSLAHDGNNDIYLAGSFSSPVLNIDNFQINNPGTRGGLILKMNSSGVVQWAKSIATQGNLGELSFQLTVSQGSVIVSGTYSDSNSIIGNSVFTGHDDLFIASFNFEGDYQWVASAKGSSLYEKSSGLAAKDDNVYVGGTFQSLNLVFGIDTLSNPSANNPPYWWEDIFLAKLHIEPTGFEDVALKGTLQVYPNPAAGLFNVVVPGGTNMLRIYDGLGCLLQQYQNPATGELSIRVSNSGLFLIQAINQNGVLNARVVVR